MKERPKPVIAQTCLEVWGRVAFHWLLESNPSTFRLCEKIMRKYTVYRLTSCSRVETGCDECFFNLEPISTPSLHSAVDQSTQAHFSKPTPAGESNHVGGESSPEEVEVLLSKQKDPKKPSFLRSLIKAFGPYFLIGSAFKLLQDLITFVNPQLLK